MSWFGEQIQSRIRRDRERVSDALLQVADSVDGKSRFHPRESETDVVRTEVDRICHYFELEAAKDIPETDRINDLIDYLVRPLGIMRRRVNLDGSWWKNGDGPLLAVEKDTGRMCALIPGRFYGYRFFDRKTNRWTRVTAANRTRFETGAVCFYRPLPARSMTGRELIGFLLRHICPGDVIMILSAVLLTTLVGFIMPLITQIIFSRIIPARKYILLLSAVMLLISSSVGSYLLSSVKIAVMSRLNSRMDTMLQNGMIARVLNLPVSFFSNKSAGSLSQSVGALASLPGIITDLLFGTGITVAMSILYIVQVAVMTPALSLPAFVTFALEILLITVCMRQKSRAIREQLESEQQTQGLVFSLFSGIQKIKLSGSENRAFAKWAGFYQRKVRASYQFPFPAFMQGVLLTAVQMIGMAIAYAAAVHAGITVAGFAAFSSAFGMIMAALSGLSASTDLVAYIGPVLEAGEPLLNAVPEVSANKKMVDTLRGSVELNNVSFRYEKDGPLILDSLNLKISPGEYVAIVGKSGCGKSTLLRLLLGFETPDEGAIYYGSRDLSTLDLASFRRNIGTVLQNGKLFSGDIFSNITISAPWLKMEDAWEAARLAGMEESIREMPMGMHTLISEGSGGVSGGQRQRLMIARAIAPRPSILMFDEATSALDNITQKVVADSLSHLDCTRIVVAHRLSTIRDCDRIVVLDGGHIVEDGTYDELIAKKGFFADLVSRQQVNSQAS